MKKTLLSLCMLLVLPFMHAQNYTFSLQNAAYVPLTGSTSLTNGTPWSAYSGLTASANIGFNFIADGNLNTNTINISPDILPTVVFSNQPNPSLGFVYGPLIAVTADRGIVSGTGLSNISYKVEGAAGNRIFKMEWNNIGFYNEIQSDNVSSDFMNIQLWLYEGSNIIEYHYGASNISNPMESFDGDPGFGCGLYPEYDFNTDEILGSAYAISGNGSNPTHAFTQNFQVFVTSMPASGTVYRFTPANLSTNETAAAQDVEIYPTLVEDSFTVNPKSGSKIISVAVYDMSGKIINSSKNTSQVSMQSVPRGGYNVVVKTDTGTTTARILKK